MFFAWAHFQIDWQDKYFKSHYRYNVSPSGCVAIGDCASVNVGGGCGGINVVVGVVVVVGGGGIIEL